jgi:hypothetical protein
MDGTADAAEPAFRDRPAVVWVNSRAPLAVAAGVSAVALAALALWVTSGHLPGEIAEVLFGLAIFIVIRERAPFTEPEGCTAAGVVVLGFGWSTAVACGVMVSVQRSTWAWGAPVAWWVHVLVALGIIGLTGAVSWAVVLACFLVSEDAAFLGASWGVVVGVVVAFSVLWFGGVGIWVGMLAGGVAALVAGPPLTALLRVRLVPIEIDETPMR